MSKVYKIWLHLEEIDEDKDHYEDICMPVEIGAFDNQEEAEHVFGVMEGVLNAGQENIKQ